MKIDFPLEITEYFNLRWNNEDLHEIKAQVNIGDVKDFDWHLHYPFWATKPPQKIFDLEPIEVIKNREKFIQHYERIMNVDITYPIETTKINNRIVILDGIHRLAKHVITKKEKIKFRIIARKYIENA